MQLAKGDISEFREVTIFFRRDGVDASSYVIHKDEIPLFVEAAVRLHFSPGVNPHTGGVTEKAWLIEARPFVVRRPLWWCRPSLTDDGPGAHPVWAEGDAERLWVDEEWWRHIVREEEALQDRLERYEAAQREECGWTGCPRTRK